MAPALVEAIKVAGLVLVADTSGDNGHRSSYPIHERTDGVLQGNGVLRFNETVDM